MASVKEKTEFLEGILADTLEILGYPPIDELMEAYEESDEEGEEE
jgi:hypothetical protein